VDTVVEGDIRFVKGDTLYNGLIKIYNLSGKLISEINYKNNDKNGLSVNYDENGKVVGETNYYYGLKNGQQTHIEGDMKYYNNFFYGQKAGEEIQYKNGKVYYYSCSNLEGIDIYSCTYITDTTALQGGRLLDYFTQIVARNDKKMLRFFIYLFKPPHIDSLYYEVVDNDSITGKQFNIATFNSTDFFFNDTLFNMPQIGHNYLLRTHLKEKKSAFKITEEIIKTN